MQISCPQCHQLLEAPVPLPESAQCPFCQTVFSPAESPVPGGVVPVHPAAAIPDVSGSLMGPAIGLLVVGILWILFALLGWVQALAGPLPAQQLQDVPPQFQQTIKEIMEVAGKAEKFLGPVRITMGLIICYAGYALLKMKSYAWAVTGSIVAMLPCSCCCSAGLPVGIWSLVVLSRPEVQDAFRLARQSDA